MAAAKTDAEPNWREEIYQAIKELEIKQVHYVPDAGHSHVIDKCLADPDIEAGMLANEFGGSASAAAHGWAVSARLC
tara:strand:- start:261 stop:491 length:231 start_codon:yes stop_codon:yes gene_type:complete